MRRDMHRWFLVGMALSSATAVVTLLVTHDADVAATVVLCLCMTMPVLTLIGWYRRRTWWRLAGTYRDATIPSRELRCRPPEEPEGRRGFTVVTK